MKRSDVYLEDGSPGVVWVVAQADDRVIDMKTYNYAETLAMLNEVADEMGRDTVYSDLRKADIPDFVGGSCLNVHTRPDGTVVPGCIVGQVVVKKLGIPAEDVKREAEGAPAGTMLNWLARAKRVDFTNKAAALLEMVQLRQDTGTPWGDAIAVATESFHAQRSLDN